MKRHPAALPIVFVVVIVLLWFGYQCFVEWKYPELAQRGLYGDMFGGLNAVFSGLAFAGVIYTILLQRQELSLQRKELELTREELKRTATANEDAAQALGKQIQMQLTAGRLSALSTLLAAANAKIENYFTLLGARRADMDANRAYTQGKADRERIEAELNKLLNEIAQRS